MINEKRTFSLILIALVTKDVALLLEASKFVANLAEALGECGEGVWALGACAWWV